MAVWEKQVFGIVGRIFKIIVGLLLVGLILIITLLIIYS